MLCFVNNNNVVFKEKMLPTSPHFHTKIAHQNHIQNFIHILKLWNCGKLPILLKLGEINVENYFCCDFLLKKNVDYSIIVGDRKGFY